MHLETPHLETPAAIATKQFRDRDLAWLDFNLRVLHEAADERNPLLERVKFLAIVGSNLDEFFMKRVGALKQQLALQTDTAGDGGILYLRLLDVRKAILDLLASSAELYTNTLLPELARNGIHLLGWSELTEHQAEAARQFFQRKVFPILTPLAVDPGHPFPLLSNLSTSLGVMLRNPETDGRYFARVKVPGSLPQLLALPSEPNADGSPSPQCFIRQIDLIRHNLDALFPGMVVLEVLPFRITRSAAVELDDDERGESLAAMVEEEIRQRRFERVIRLEYATGVSPAMLQLLLGKLDLSEVDAYEMTAELDYTDLFVIAGLNRPELRDKPWQPIVPPAFEGNDLDIFSVIRAGDVLVHHPYESFEATVERFIRRAAVDPKVVALKMTVYRVGAETPFLDALVAAAGAGKEVACLVEVTASFDELQNLTIAHALEKAGVHVVYGVVGLKTHCKTALVVRQDDDGLRCYVHIGSGNYHVKTARLYTDLGLFTCNPELTGDVVNLFHYLTGLSLKRDYAKLLVAPVNMRERFLEMIRGEIAHRQAGRPAHIIAKMNQLEDREICEALIDAARAGVQIDMIIRGLCVLRPDASDNIRVISVIGRFLEHSRIYYFRNGSEDPLAGLFFIGSADWMHRNLSGRVEAITPIETPELRQRLWELLQILLTDQRQAWDMLPDGTYRQRTPPRDGDPTRSEVLGTHQLLMTLTQQGWAASDG
jgi:polyphosphate kinase